MHLAQCFLLKRVWNQVSEPEFNLVSGEHLGRNLLTFVLVHTIVTVLLPITPPRQRNALTAVSTLPLVVPAFHWLCLTVLDKNETQKVYSADRHLTLFTFPQPGCYLLIWSILAVLLAITEPLFLQTLMAVWTAQLCWAAWWSYTIELIRVVTAVSISITSQTLRDTLTTTTAILMSCTGNQSWRFINIMFTQYLTLDWCYTFHLTSHTTLFLIRSISAVFLTITQEGLRYTACVVITALMAALRQTLTVSFIRLVLTVILSITHLLPQDAPISMSTLELSWETEQSLLKDQPLDQIYDINQHKQCTLTLPDFIFTILNKQIKLWTNLYYFSMFWATWEK